MKKTVCLLLAIMLFVISNITIFANSDTKYGADYRPATIANFKINAKSALLMEANTGKILFSQNENEKALPR